MEGVLIVYCNVFLDNSQFPHFRISFYFDVINYEIDFSTPNFTHSDNELRKKQSHFFFGKHLDYLVSCEWFLIEINRALIFQFWRRAVSAVSLQNDIAFNNFYLSTKYFQLRKSTIHNFNNLTYFQLLFNVNLPNTC